MLSRLTEKEKIAIVAILIIVLVVIIVICMFCRRRSKSCREEQSPLSSRHQIKSRKPLDSDYRKKTIRSMRKQVGYEYFSALDRSTILAQSNFRAMNIKGALENNMVARPMFKVLVNAIGGMQPFNDVPVGYSPAYVKDGYGIVNVNADGSGQKIAVILAYKNPTAIADFKHFDQTFNLGHADKLTVFSNATTVDSGWSMESCLDIQWSHAMAPAADIILVEAASASLKDLSAAVKLAISKGANIISMSWGSTEFSSQTLYNSVFSTPGIVFLASSGDTGGVVNWPSSAKNVLAVGGTSLNLASDGTYVTETGWNGSGGGISKFESMPQWQKTFGLKGKRQTPDIGLVADPQTGVAIYSSGDYNGQTGWFEIGGTSLSCPATAGILALANQMRVSSGKKTLDTTSLCNYLYSNTSTKTNYASSFNDIAQGTAGRNQCKFGYDNVTGLGTPKNGSNSGFIYDLVTLIP
jgi:subtilase family serine protease